MENTFFKDYQDLINSFEALKKEADNPFFKSKYVPLNKILPIVKQKCTEHNFALIQRPKVLLDFDTKPINTLVTELMHKDGKVIKGQIELIAKDPTDPQKVGGGLTYMRRYSLTCMLGLEEEDDDGNNASEKVYTSPNYPKGL